MKRRLFSRAGFTLVELIVVMGVIIILAGLVVAVAPSAVNRSFMARAQSEIQGMSAAAESFKADNGDYPRVALSNTNYSSDGFDPTQITPPAAAAGDSGSYSKVSLVLYTNLSGDLNCSGIGGQTDPTTQIKHRVYFEFSPKTLYPRPSGGAATIIKALVDPWGVPYGYSTLYEATIQQADGQALNSQFHGYNPTFDLWSTCNVTPPKPGTLPPGSPSDPQLRWVKNWQ